MNDIPTTIREYEKSCGLIAGRILELNEDIRRAYEQGCMMKNLVERRYRLYTELTEMQGALRELREYVEETEGGALPGGVA